MPTAKPVDLKQLPGYSQGVRNSATLRDVVVAQPICPKSQIRGKIVNGQYEPPEIGPDDINCQLAGGEWWIDCEAKGHDPYFRHIKTYSTIDITETGDDGSEYVVGTKKRVRDIVVLNVTSVSPDVGHSSGLGLSRKMKHLGYRRVADLGFAEVCQYRACMKAPQYRVLGIGDYCSLEHLNLIAARQAEEFLTLENQDQRGLNVGYEAQSQRKRAKQLAETMPRNVEKIK